MKLDHWKLEAVEVEDAEELFWPTSPTRYYSIPRSTQQQQQRPPPRMDKLMHSPTPLQQLALEAFLAQLKNLCQEKNYGENKRALKHYLKFQLPATIRQQLLDMSMKDSRIYTLIDVTYRSFFFFHSARGAAARERLFLAAIFSSLLSIEWG
ncbi:hypothetical protein DAPPUDRAFT_111981 [Daphnia pulex]|uniref:Uncharacterized protein n=1 Tax=Daphnia pulex TaxID=6669 RepID=E9HAN0_DAPPU|nr:hypothetical protein DAPPUDRAFT_111981 [Daphnia pulex]|eukprot:EFX71210.1 hypothetical protein DAPPUDRAFT_111981 [Daphnia pulex]